VSVPEATVAGAAKPSLLLALPPSCSRRRRSLHPNPPLPAGHFPYILAAAPELETQLRDSRTLNTPFFSYPTYFPSNIYIIMTLPHSMRVGLAGGQGHKGFVNRMEKRAGKFEVLLNLY
jgi:hypothetical protein